MLAEPCEGKVQVTFGTGIENVNSLSEHLTGCPHRRRGIRIARVDEVGNCIGPGTNSLSSSSCFASNSLAKKLTPVTFPPGRLRLSTKPILTGSEPRLNTIGIVVVAVFPRHRRGAACRGDDSNSPTHKIGSHGWELIGLVLGPPVFDRDIPGVDKARFAQALKEGGHHARVWLG